MKSFFSIIAALLTAVIVISLIEMISHKMYPMPLGVDIKDKQALDAWISTLPTGAFLIVLLAWFLGAISGGFVASYLDPDQALRRSGVVCSILIVATLFNLYEFPHPLWMWFCGIISILAGVYLGYKILCNFVVIKTDNN